jgi:glycosyltransferase involved in cell wall biosynthesis
LVVATAPTLRSGSTLGRARRFGILSTYPPTACGLATFSAALATGLEANGAEAVVVRIQDGATPFDPDEIVAPRVIGNLVAGSAASISAAAELLNGCDVAVVQHEYGVYGGPDGDEVLAVMAELRVPSIVIAHTILLDPTPHQRSVLVAAATLADRVVVMSAAAGLRLCERFDVDAAKVVTIPHGAAIPTGPIGSDRPLRPTMLTWGLIGPGKGIERVIDAMAILQEGGVRPRYLVAGRTHPKVLIAEGEAYRDARIEQARRNGVADSVTFDAEYRDVASLTALIRSAAVVVLPYDSRDQVTSGVLVDAIASGRPVVSTAFPHAVELLASGAGLVVEQDDPEAMAAALQRVLTEPGLADSMAAEAARLAPSMGWSVVAGAYVELADRLVDAPKAFA